MRAAVLSGAPPLVGDHVLTVTWFPRVGESLPLTSEEGGLFPSSVTGEVSMVSPVYAWSGDLTSRKREEREGSPTRIPVYGCLLSCVQLFCDPVECCPTGSSVHRILQQAYWNGLPCLPPGDLLNPGIKTADSLR